MKKEFPFNTQLDPPFDIIENEDKLDLWLFEQKDENYPYDYGYLIKDSDYIYTPSVADKLRRYKLQKEFGIYSYSKKFEDIPAIWIDMLNIISSEIPKALKEKNRLGN